jgi:2-keto-3-deoxy-L-fuconate dehydrogenase
MGSFAGLSALVTGGASGIGLATARALAAQAARVAVLDLAPHGPADLAYVRADVSDDAAVQEAVAAAVARLGGLDVLVNNAGIGAQGGAPQQCATWPLPPQGSTTGTALAVDGGMQGLRLRPRS